MKNNLDQSISQQLECYFDYSRIFHGRDGEITIRWTFPHDRNSIDFYSEDSKFIKFRPLFNFEVVEVCDYCTLCFNSVIVDVERYPVPRGTVD